MKEKDEGQFNGLESESTAGTPIDIKDYFDDLAADIEGPTTPFIILCKFVILHYDIKALVQDYI